MFVSTKIIEEVDLCNFPAYKQISWQWSCSAYAVSACLNILWIKVDPQVLRDEVVKWPASAWSWRVAWVCNYIKSKYRILSKKILGLNQILLSLTKGNPILLETHNINFPETWRSSWAICVFDQNVKWKHVWCIIWYSKKTRLLKCRNSHWEQRWDKWYFYIKFQDIWNLWVMYSLYK